MAVVNGTGGTDVLNGTTGNDVINGLGGDDVIIALDGNNTIDGGTGDDIVISGKGNDTFYVDSPQDVITDLSGTDTIILLSGSHLMDGGIERLIVDELALAASVSGNLSANVITGNSYSNSLGGAGGNDTLDGGTSTVVGGVSDILDGGAGSDKMTGHDGDDTYIVDSSADKVFEVAGEGTDLVLTSATWVMSAEVEDLTITGTGSAGATGNVLNNIINGNSANNQLRGMGGADTITGGAGMDAMYGGIGNDTFDVDNSKDKVVELAGEGTDVVNASASYKLGAEIEILHLTGTGNIAGTGNVLDNTITGNTGDNTIDGGLGADDMTGGTGNDTYVVERAGDFIHELNGEGNDTAQSYIPVNLATDAHFSFVENAILLGTAQIDATGTTGDNILGGSLNTAVNTLTGGTGNDTYFIDVHDVVVEAPGDAHDMLAVAFTFDLNNSMATIGGTNILVSESNIEDLMLTGTSAINGFGDNNAAGNIIIGNSGANTLDGRDGDDTLSGGGGIDHLIGGLGNDVLDGGLAADTMIGGQGDDTYTVDNVKDIVVDVVGGGTDLVQSYVTYNLNVVAPASFGVQQIENLTLLGAANINGTGDGFVNTITGNTGNNTLDGGLGADTMDGDLGNDVFIVNQTGDVVLEATSATSGGGIDTVMSGVDFDFSTGAEVGQDLENLTLTGTALVGTGNGLDNVITGNAQVNTLAGLLGNDTYVLGTDIHDTIADSGGNDTISVAYTFNLFTTMATVGTVDTFMHVTGIENITLTGKLAINATGDNFANILTGNTGINTFDGMGGDDTYVIGAKDVILTDSNGTDLVISNGSYSFAGRTDLENITLIGTGNFNATGDDTHDNTLIGNIGNNILSGGLGADSLYGDKGNDTLDGGTGGDIDTMVGGLGNDTYIVDVAPVGGVGGDVVVESTLANEGTDTIISSVDYSIDQVVNPNFIYIENLTLTGTAVSGTGNDSNNKIIGDAMANTLYGGLGNDTLQGGAGDDVLSGDAGSDVMIGGAGNDVYYVDVSSDVVVDTAGIDIVLATASFTLPTGVEYLTLLPAGGDIGGTGNELNNILIGNASNNFLFGAAGNDVLVGGDGNDVLDGGVGVDTMTGGLGDDTYVIDTKFDNFVENPGEGNDTLATVYSVLNIPTNFENITLRDAAPAGTSTVIALFAIGDNNANILTGNSLANTLTGNNGNDLLIGNGGIDTMDGGQGNDTLAGDFGADTLTGGLGIDVFVLSAGGVDTIRDFNTAQGDKLNIGNILDYKFYVPGVSDIHDYVKYAVISGSTHVYVDPDGPTQLDGSRATDFIEVATLSGVVLHDPAIELANGNLEDLPFYLGL